jgi:hypothetical protein
MIPTVVEDLSDDKGMKFNPFSSSNNDVGDTWLNITASVSPNYPKLEIRILVKIGLCEVKRLLPTQ